jgi:transposase
MELSIMRYELSDYEWSVIRPMLLNKPRGIPRVDDRRILNGILDLALRRTMARSAIQLWPAPTTCYKCTA